MRLHTVRTSRHRRSLIAAPLFAGALALVASACSSSSPGSSTATTPTGSSSPAALLAAGLAAQKAGNVSVAVSDYKKVIALSPTSSTASFANYDLGVIAQIDQNDPAAAETTTRLHSR